LLLWHWQQRMKMLSYLFIILFSLLFLIHYNGSWFSLIDRPIKGQGQCPWPFQGQYPWPSTRRSETSSSSSSQNETLSFRCQQIKCRHKSPFSTPPSSFAMFKSQQEQSVSRQTVGRSLSQPVKQPCSHSVSQLFAVIRQTLRKPLVKSVMGDKRDIIFFWLTDWLVDCLTDSQSVRQSVSQTINQSVSQTINQSVKSASQSVSQSDNQPVSQSVNQSVNQSTKQ